MVEKKPIGYDAARLTASDDPIEFSDVERFVFEDAPGVDTGDCQSLHALDTVWQGRVVKVKPKGLPDDLVDVANNDPRVLYYARFCEDRHLFKTIERAEKVVPIFTLRTDIYACYDAGYDWWKHRVASLNNVTNLDNGWLNHGLRLLSRYQEYRLLKTQSWWKDNQKFELDQSCRTRWESKKQRRGN